MAQRLAFLGHSVFDVRRVFADHGALDDPGVLKLAQPLAKRSGVDVQPACDLVEAHGPRKEAVDDVQRPPRVQKVERCGYGAKLMAWHVLYIL